MLTTCHVVKVTTCHVVKVTTCHVVKVTVHAVVISNSCPNSRYYHSISNGCHGNSSHSNCCYSNCILQIIETVGSFQVRVKQGKLEVQLKLEETTVLMNIMITPLLINETMMIVRSSYCAH